MEERNGDLEERNEDLVGEKELKERVAGLELRNERFVDDKEELKEEIARLEWRNER